MSSDPDPAIAVPQTPLSAGDFILRPWRPEDADWYIAARDEAIFSWTTEPRDLAPEALARAITDNAAKPRWVALAIARPDGTPIGNLSLTPAADRRWAEASYWLAPEGRGQGAATAALEALTAWAFAVGVCEGVFLKIASGNAASRAVAARCGFIEAGREGESLRYERRR